MSRATGGALLPSNAFLTAGLCIVLMSAAVESGKHHKVEPPNLSHMPEWTFPRAAGPGTLAKEQPEITLTYLAPGWSVVKNGAAIVTWPLYIRLAPWLWQ